MRPHELLTREQRTKGVLVTIIALTGFLPVSSIALHCAGIISLINCAIWVIVPLVVLCAFICIANKEIRQQVFYGWMAGILAVALYDLSRVPYIMNGWSDFIPNIGAWLTNSTQPDATIGYIWRYAGNGGGMGVAFFVLMKYFRPYGNMIQNGILYGLFIFSSLMFVLILSEQAEDMMFRITPLAFTGSLTGHIVYGLSLGILARRYFSKNQPSMVHVFSHA